eukprot:m.130545 g.130545  ORF g.130545 m.130545 type:complete len:545 (+) comp38032_c0_seq9:121-1755(+)
MASSCTKRGADVETTPENLSLAKRKKEFSRLDDTKDYDDISDDIRKSSRDSMPLRVRTSEKALRSVVKIFVQSTTPNCSMPWQMKRQRATYGSGFVVSGRRLLTNAHVVAYQTSVRVRKHGDAKKYTAHVICVGHECDVALLGVDDETFWNDLEALDFGPVPHLEEDVVCVGFPTGGDNICITRGVVSRVDITRYSYSGVYLLAVQIDAAINSGNSGGPALQGDYVIGMAFETLNNAENIGYIIPIPVINHFLKDYEVHGSYVGFCRMGIRWQKLESECMRKYIGLSLQQTGILITRVLPMCPALGILQKGDVLMSIDSHDIADNGTVHFRGNERITFGYALSGKYVQDKCRVKIFRKREVQEIALFLGTMPDLVPRLLNGKRPSYLVHGGLVFTPLTQPFLSHQWGRDWEEKAPVQLCSYVTYGYVEKKRQEIVILSQVLSHELTVGYEGIAFLQLLLFNGKEVVSLQHLAEMLDAEADTLKKGSAAEFMHFQLDRDKEIALPLEKSFHANTDLLAAYSIAQPRSDDLPALQLVEPDAVGACV